MYSLRDLKSNLGQCFRFATRKLAKRPWQSIRFHADIRITRGDSTLAQVVEESPRIEVIRFDGRSETGPDYILYSPKRITRKELP